MRQQISRSGATEVGMASTRFIRATHAEAAERQALAIFYNACAPSGYSLGKEDLNEA
jgi:hypothetical protein